MSDPVALTIGQKDGICNGCHVGAHCFDRGLEFAMDTPDGLKRVFANDIDDMFALSAFINAARALKDAGRVDEHLGFPIDETRYITDPSAEAIPILASNMISFQPPVLTNAGFVKAVLAHY